jgi:hypothetical protein
MLIAIDQCRHTFASLMLQAGEDPAWVARMLGHTTTKMLYERYHRFIQHRTRQDGALYLKRLEGGSVTNLAPAKKQGLRDLRNPLIFRAGPTRLELATSGVTGQRSG